MFSAKNLNIPLVPVSNTSAKEFPSSILSDDDENADPPQYRGFRKNEPNVTKSTIIPLKFNAQIDGIGGLVIGNVFKLPKDRLPMAYAGNDIHFIVMGEEQEINSNQDWTPTISGHLILLGNVSSEEYKKSKQTK